MKSGKFYLLAIVINLFVFGVSCVTPLTPESIPTAPNMGSIRHDSPPRVVPDLSMVIEVPPFPYSRPLPPTEPSPIDGLYTKMVPLEGTPVPCMRCAGYRLEGGVWSLYFNLGTYKFFQQDTAFESVGSFTVSGDRIAFFNDPYCEEDLAMVGIYTWKMEKDSLTLQVVDDPCSIGLRAKNLVTMPWTRKRDPCQPPNIEAGITDHWNKPPRCK
jgi:hypothetical protein